MSLLVSEAKKKKDVTSAVWRLQKSNKTLNIIYLQLVWDSLETDSIKPVSNSYK